MPIAAGTVIYTDKTTPAATSLKYVNQSGTWPVTGSRTAVYSYRKGLRRPRPTELDDTPYELKKFVFTGITGNWSTTSRSNASINVKYTGTTNAGYLGNPNIASVRYRNSASFDFDSDVRDLATLRALSDLNLKDVDLGTALREMGKTAGLVGDLAHLTASCVRHLMKRDLRGFLETLKPDVVHRLPGGQTVVDTYLTYHYAIKPTLQEIAGAVQAITRQPVENTRMTVKGRYVTSGEKDAKIDLGSNLWVRGVTTYVDSCRVLISAVRKKETRADDMRWALGLDDPISTAWEITPWSFVIDWALPIGDWLASVNASKHYTDWRVSKSQYLRENTQYSGTKHSSATYNFESSVKGSLETFKLRRVVTTNLPMVGVPFKNPVSVDHMAKGLSLLAAVLARGGEVPRYLRY